MNQNREKKEMGVAGMEYKPNQATKPRGFDPEWGYYYHITICTENRRPLLCHLLGQEGIILPTPIGQKVSDRWLRLDANRDDIAVNQFCLMPNHIHGILVVRKPQAKALANMEGALEELEDAFNRALENLEATMEAPAPEIAAGETLEPSEAESQAQLEEERQAAEALAQAEESQAHAAMETVVHAFQAETSAAYRDMLNETRPISLWQISYYHELIRDAERYQTLCNYIQGNRFNWTRDRFYNG